MNEEELVISNEEKAEREAEFNEELSHEIEKRKQSDEERVSLFGRVWKGK